MMLKFVFPLCLLAMALPAQAASSVDADTMALDNEEVIVPSPNAAAPSPYASPAEPSCTMPSISGLGSYNRANLAAMIEDPEDLCTGRPLGPADAGDLLDRNDKALNAAPAAPTSASPAAAAPSRSGGY